MTLHPKIVAAYPKLNEAQKSIVGHEEGPLLVIAGPGSGKTFSLVLRTLNLLLNGKAKPGELVLCTYTEKAAFELRDRLSAAARTVGLEADLSVLKVTTIHGLCNKILQTHRHRTHLGASFTTLDDLTQLLFIHDEFKAIIGEPENDLYLGKWKTPWTAIKGVRDYFNKMTEELVDPARLAASPQVFHQALGAAYDCYRAKLREKNRVDFSHLLRVVYDLLLDESCLNAVRSSVKYLMVDEYQDTNTIQEEICLKLSGAEGNICVVGDEDQSLYRFRGATVRNILEFQDRFPGLPVVQLTANYRSHPDIVTVYDRWMGTADWKNPDGRPFRYPKTIKAAVSAPDTRYQPIIALWGKDETDEAARFADMIAQLKAKSVIEDYSQVALLLHSVRQDHSAPYLEALRSRKIPVFCPRARGYFECEEVRQVMACFALVLGFYGEKRGSVLGRSVKELADYADECIAELPKTLGVNAPLFNEIRKIAGEIEGLKEGEGLDARPADLFYRFLAFDPFIGHLRDENRARNLATFSQLVNTFQNYYHFTVVTHQNRDWLRRQFFNSYLRLLFDGGINEYEDPDRPFPKGYVQVMTIHQSKGLEFPVVVVGSLTDNIKSPKAVDRDLQAYYPRPPFEPEERVTNFDRMRLHYVAFSRAEKVLVLTASGSPKDHFAPIWQGLPQWPYVEKDLLAAQRFTLRERIPPKKSYSFTGDLRVYETCPRQYRFFRSYEFAPSRSSVIFFGLLVHQTIEEIHRKVLDGAAVTLTETVIRDMFDRTFANLCLQDVRPIGREQREAAFRQVMDYFTQNRTDLGRVLETEVDVSVEKEGYYLVGKVDLLMGGDGKLELLDFKTSRRPTMSAEMLDDYKRQLCTYAHILEKRYRKKVDRLYLYWTGERLKKDALMEIAYDPKAVEEAGRHFDDVVGKIREGCFEVARVPDKAICQDCDIRPHCRALETLKRK
jgi:DNA helicase-2/ATP-dependent DNA helicase PcrA